VNVTPVDLPPAVVLGVDTPIGLTVVRELGERGVPVLGIGRSSDALGFRSRYLAAGFVRPIGEGALVALLNQLAEERQARFLITISESDAVFARRVADHGELKGLRPLVPEESRLKVVNDKLTTYQIARRLGIRVPTTWQPERVEAIAERVGAVEFPCVLKWRDPHIVAPDLARIGETLRKSEYCYEAASLRAALMRYAPIGRFPLVQSFCPGEGLGQMLFMSGGKALLRFQHRRLAEWPPEGGFSTVCESLPPSAHAELMAKSEALLAEIGWEGPAMVEYRFDPRTQSAALMEINGRFWGSLPLAYHAGAPFAWFTYAVLGLGRKEIAPPYRAGMRCRYMVPETKRLFVLCFNTGFIQNRELKFSPSLEVARYFAGFFRPRMRYYVFSFRDPAPFLGDARQIFSKAVTGFGRRVASAFTFWAAAVASKLRG
jgi:predicted ATP-grasp superfamily ATP-dependent carboligase